jgi:ABC-type ATPase with predicted acetyltransferase domain
MIQVWECVECGWEQEGDRRPKECPTCGAGGDSFDVYEYEDTWDDDEDEDEDDG